MKGRSLAGLARGPQKRRWRLLREKVEMADLVTVGRKSSTAAYKSEDKITELPGVFRQLEGPAAHR